LTLLIVYFILLGSSSYFAFVHEVYNPVLDPEIIETISKSEPDIQRQQYDALKMEAETYKKTKDLAITSFNIILGSLISFLATIAISTREKDS